MKSSAALFALVAARRIDGATAKTRYVPDYSKGFAKGVCKSSPAVPNGVVSYESQLECCEKSYSGQSSGACLFSLPPDPERAAVQEEWYPVYDLGWNGGVCSKGRPPSGVISWGSQLECCSNAYAGQSSGACLSEVPASEKERAGMTEEWFPDYSEEICVSTLSKPRNGVPAYASQVLCCVQEFGNDKNTPPVRCFADLPNPPTVSPTEVGGGGSFWYPDYSLGWGNGICVNKLPVPDGIITFASHLACCEFGYNGQSTGRCIQNYEDSLALVEDATGKPSTLSPTGIPTKTPSGTPTISGGPSLSSMPTETPTIELEMNATLTLSLVEDTNNRQTVRQTGCLSDSSVTIIEQTLGQQIASALTGNQKFKSLTIIDASGPCNSLVVDYKFRVEEPCNGNGNGKDKCEDHTTTTSTDIQESLDDSITDGSFTTDLQTNAAESCTGDCTELSTVTVTEATVSEPEVVIPSPTLAPVSLAPIILPTPQTLAPSPPPTDLSIRRLAKQIDRLFGSKMHESLAQDRRQLRTALEETFGNVDDVKAIMEMDSSTTGGDFGSTSALSIEKQDDYYNGLPEFANIASGSLECKCVDCKQDKTCGGLWKGKGYSGTLDLKRLPRIHTVVAHCAADLGWIAPYTEGFELASIHVISICGKEVTGVPDIATIEAQPDIVDFNHAFAHYITTTLPKEENEGSGSIIVFLKGDANAQNKHSLNDFSSLVEGAASEQGFGCGITSGVVNFGKHSFLLSAYYETKTLRSFVSMDSFLYEKLDFNDHSNTLTQFKDFGTWWDETIGTDEPQQEAVPVCHGGAFSSSLSNINRRHPMVWKNIESSFRLSHGNVVTQTSQYAKRSWAALLSMPLQLFKMEALLEKADGVHVDKYSYSHGALIRRPTLYIHVGVEGTSSTEVLTESLVENIELLQEDEYMVAVHGKYQDGRYGFPNIDRLGSCLWDDQSKSLFPEHMKEATICDQNLLPALTSYMEDVRLTSHDMIMLNPWLVRPGSAGPLSLYLDSVFDVKVVIYYRRFFEWFQYKYDEWRADLFENSLSMDKVKIPSSSFRYIDFIREYCKQLLYGKDINEDGFPLRGLHRDEDGEPKNKAKLSTAVSTFDPTTNLDVMDLTGLKEYVYFVAKEYHSQPRFRRSVRIVNAHDAHGVETNFYCQVLHDAQNSCRHVAQRSSKSWQEKHSQMNATFALNPSTALEDIAIKAYLGGRLSFDTSLPRKKFMQQISLWIEMMAVALKKEDVLVENLPIECLYNYEKRRLLEASLAYEKSLLPEFYASPLGAQNLRQEFGRRSFCSVDTEAILSEERWSFLFEDASNFVVPEQRRAFIHIGAPRTGGELLEKALASDQSVLKEDNFVYFSPQAPGHLAPCVWSEAEQELVGTGSCSDHMLSNLHEFLSNATDARADVVIADEWLSMESTEAGLLDVLENFEPVTVIYYRRFFGWLLSSYSAWHADVDTSTLKGRVRLVDFIRLLCSDLFSSSEIHDHANVDLLAFPDYTYSLWKRFTKIPAYKKNVRVVNMHDGHVVKSFYCDVLGAEKACKLQSDRLKNEAQASSETRPLVPKLFEVAMGANPGANSRDYLYKLANSYKAKMALRGLTEDDLPKECLTRAETTMLLKISLGYERVLFPNDISTEEGGEGGLKQHFSALVESDAFCSVDLERMMDSLRWEFLFVD